MYRIIGSMDEVVLAGRGVRRAAGLGAASAVVLRAAGLRVAVLRAAGLRAAGLRAAGLRGAGFRAAGFRVAGPPSAGPRPVVLGAGRLGTLRAHRGPSLLQASI